LGAAAALGTVVAHVAQVHRLGFRVASPVARALLPGGEGGPVPAQLSGPSGVVGQVGDLEGIRLEVIEFLAWP